MIKVLILNYNQSNLTVNCIDSIVKSKLTKYEIHLLDNGSNPNDFEVLQKQYADEKRISLYRLEKNRSFTGGYNHLFEKVLPDCEKNELIMLLNNDTIVDEKMFEKISSAAKQSSKQSIFVPKMMKLDDHNKIDNLGLSLAKSGIAFNRKKPSKQKLFGPCGGCAIFTKKCLEEIKEKTGEYFDSDYVCYGEDADLAWRALLLGYKPIYLEDAICYHKGGGTNGNTYNELIMYHGIRNNLFNLVKNAPFSFLLRNSASIIIMQLLIITRFLPTRKATVLLKIYRDFFKLFPKMLKKRGRIQAARKISYQELKPYLTNEFYDWTRIKNEIKSTVKQHPKKTVT